MRQDHDAIDGERMLGADASECFTQVGDALHQQIVPATLGQVHREEVTATLNMCACVSPHGRSIVGGWGIAGMRTASSQPTTLSRFGSTVSHFDSTSSRLGSMLSYSGSTLSGFYSLLRLFCSTSNGFHSTLSRFGSTLNRFDSTLRLFCPTSTRCRSSLRLFCSTPNCWSLALITNTCPATPRQEIQPDSPYPATRAILRVLRRFLRPPTSA